MNKIIYPKIREYDDSITYFDGYLKRFQNKKNRVEFGYFCAKEILHLIKDDQDLYENYKNCLDLIKLWLIKPVPTENIDIFRELMYNYLDVSDYNFVRPIYHLVNSIRDISDMVDYTKYCSFYCLVINPQLLPYVQKLIQMYLREEKQFNIKEHNNTYQESILKQITNIEYEKLEETDKNQVIDIINEYYDIEVNQFDFITYKTIQREFI